MELSNYFKSYIESEREAVFICDMNYRILYINPSASIEYKRFGGYDMIGKDLHIFLDIEDESKINMVIEWFKESKENNHVFAKYFAEKNTDLYITALRDEKGELIGFCNRRRYRIKDTSEPYHIE